MKTWDSVLETFRQETLAKANAAAVEVLGAMRTVQANAGELSEARSPSLDTAW